MNKKIFYCLFIILTNCSKDDSDINLQAPSKKYTITVLAGSGGSVSSTGGTFNEGTLLSIQATPDNGFQFTSWSNGSTQNPLSITLTSNLNLTANFDQIIQYRLNIQADEGGTVSSDGGLYNQGTTVIISAIPNDGYVFSQWSDGNNEPNRTFTMNQDISVTATFTSTSISHNVSFTSTDGGSISTQGGVYDSGVEITIIATPDQNYRFVSWSDGNTEAERVITINSDVSLQAIFESFDPIFLDDNGVTLKANLYAEAGSTAEYNGQTYMIVSENQLREMINNNENISYVITSKVTDMQKLFEEKEVFGDLTSWDVSNVTVMYRTFFKSTNFNQNISNWDVSKVTNMHDMFAYTLFNQPIGNWDVSNVIKMQHMFGHTPFNQDISNWNVSNVDEMQDMFIQTSSFNQDISNWDVSKVLNMRGMFYGSSFNQDISSWNVSNVKYFNNMFGYSSFNQPIGNWNVSSANSVAGMFRNSSFNQPIGNWNVSNVTNMEFMFSNASYFNQDISNWDVSNVIDFRNMFGYSSFNQPIGNWNVSKAINIGHMFGQSSFNQDISNWDVSNVENMQDMFIATPFNQPIGNWNVSKVVNMRGMFYGSSFNQPIGNWNVGEVIFMDWMFRQSLFNQPIGDWDVKKVIEMKYMFMDSPFNQDISNWDVSNVENMTQMFQGSFFNKNIKEWCVSKIKTEPENFSFNSSLNDSNKPVWGICNAIDLIIYFPFNGDTNDKSGNNNHVTMNTGASLTSDRNGNQNSAYFFDGTDDYLQVEKINISDNFDNLSSLTISAWSYMEGDNNDPSTTSQSIIARVDFTGNPNGERRNFEMTVKENGSLEFQSIYNLDLNRWGINGVSSSGIYNKGQWNHVLYTYNSSTEYLKMYLNGELIYNQKFEGMELYDYDHWINIGAIIRSSGNTQFNFWKGKLDDIAIWRRALNESEIQSMSNN